MTGILGLDCATKTGWCMLDRDGRIVGCGVQDFSKRRGEGNGLVFLRFRRWLKDLLVLTPFPVGIVAYERAHLRGGAATELGVGLQTRVQEVAAELEMESAPVHTGEVKRFATGKGNAGKDEMIAAAKAILGRDPEDDNEADAVHVARWARSEFCS